MATKLPDTWLNVFWAKMIANHPSPSIGWTKIYPPGSEAERIGKASWSENLATLTVEQLRHGMERSTAEHKFPPNFAEFKEFATDGDKPRIHYEHERIKSAAEEFREHRALPRPAPDPKRAAEAVKIAKTAISKSGYRRCVLIAGESHGDYLAHLRDGKLNGETTYQTDMRLMARNGWSEQLEESYRNDAAVLGINPYPTGHKP